MRPDSIKKFDLFYLGSIAVGAINTIIHRDLLARDLQRQFAQQGEAVVEMFSGSEGVFVIGGIVLNVLLGLLLWFLVSRQKIGVIRWIIALWVAYGLISLPAMIGALPSLVAILGLFVIVLQLVALYFLFQAETTIWLKGKRIVEGDDDDTIVTERTTDPE